MVDGAHPAVVLEVAGCPSGRVELGDLPRQEWGLHRQSGQESVDGGGVFGVPQQLPRSPAGEIAPLQGGLGVFEGDAPPSLRHADGRAVPTGQERQRPVGEDDASARVAGAVHEPEAFKGVDELGGPLGRDAHEPGQLLESDPGPVRNQVEGALLGGLENDGQHMVGHVRRRPPVGKIVGEVGPFRFRLPRQLAPGGRPFELVAQVDGGGDFDGAPYPVARSGQDRLAFQGEQGRHIGGREEPAGVPETHVVGHEDEERFGERQVAQPPEPLREARPVGGESLPDDPDGPAVRQRHGGVHRHGPVPAEPDGVGDVGEGGGDVVDGGERVEPVRP